MLGGLLLLRGSTRAQPGGGALKVTTLPTGRKPRSISGGQRQMQGPPFTHWSPRAGLMCLFSPGTWLLTLFLHAVAPGLAEPMVTVN